MAGMYDTGQAYNGLGNLSPWGSGSFFGSGMGQSGQQQNMLLSPFLGGGYGGNGDSNQLTSPHVGPHILTMGGFPNTPSSFASADPFGTGGQRLSDYYRIVDQPLQSVQSPLPPQAPPQQKLQMIQSGYVGSPI